MSSIPVLIVQRILPPYRVPFFECLARSQTISPTLAYGQSDLAAIQNADAPPNIISTQKLHNYCLGKSKQIVMYQKGAMALLRSGDYRCVIAEFNPRIVSNLALAVAAKRLKIPFVWWGHGVGPSAGDLIFRFRLHLCRLARAIIFYDSDRAQRFINRGLPAEKAFVAWNSLNTETIDRVVEDWSIDKRNRLLFIGSLHPRKKLGLFLRAFASIRDRIPSDIKLTLVGEGPELPHLKQLSCDLGISNRTEFVGPFYEEQKLAEWFNTARISVCPGALGLSAIHSLAYGVPLLVADFEPHGPEFTVLQNGLTGLTFSSDDESSLGANLVAMIHDQELLHKMSTTGRRLIHERYSVTAMRETFERAVSFAVTT